MAAGIVVKIGTETYRAALAGPFIACSMTAEAWAAWQGVLYAKALLCNAAVPMRHYTDCAGLASAMRTKHPRQKGSSFYRMAAQLRTEVESLDWSMAWKGRKDPMMKEPHNLAASVAVVVPGKKR